MNILFAFSIMSFIPIFIMWIVYKMFLSRYKAPGFSRFFIIGGIISIMASFTIGRYVPTGIMLENAYVTTPEIIITQDAESWTGESGLIHAEDKALSMPVPSEASVNSSFDLLDVFLMIYCVGFIIILVGFIGSLVRILRVILHAERLSVDGRKIYIAKQADISPFSIGNIIVLNRRDYARGGKMIIQHEIGHIVHGHTWDLIILQIIITVCWYNPACWMIRKSLKVNHEYEADAYVLDKGLDSFVYQSLLLDMASNRKIWAIGNNFNYYNLKKRLKMMNSSVPKYRLAYGIFPVALLLGAILFACSNSKIQDCVNDAEASEMISESLSHVNMPDTVETQSSQYYVFLIRNVDVNSSALTDGNYLWIGDLGTTGMSDTYYDGFVYPLTKCVVTSHKRVIDSLSPKDPIYIIDNRTVSKEEYESLDADQIEIVTFEGSKVIIDTRIDVAVPNTDVPANGNEEGRQLRKLISNLEEEWQNIDTVVLDGKTFNTRDVDFSYFMEKNLTDRPCIQSLTIDGHKATIVSWPAK